MSGIRPVWLPCLADGLGDAVALAMSASAMLAEEYSITSSLTVAADSTAVRNVIGDFCDIDGWHPGIVS